MSKRSLGTLAVHSVGFMVRSVRHLGIGASGCVRQLYLLHLRHHLRTSAAAPGSRHKAASAARRAAACDCRQACFPGSGRKRQGGEAHTHGNCGVTVTAKGSTV